MSPQPDRVLSLSPGTILGLGAEQAIETAAEAGFAALGLRLDVPAEPAGGWSRLCRLLEDHRLRLLDVEVVRLRSDVPVAHHRPLAEAAGRLGATFLLVVSDHSEPARTVADLRTLAGWTAPYDVTVALEFMRFTSVPTFGAASRIVQDTGADNVGIVVDALHLHRGGERPADLVAPGAGPVAYLQLCDAPADPPGDPDDRSVLAEEARHHRWFPGTGDLPLTELLRTLPAGMPCSIEVQADGWAGAEDAVRRARQALTSAHAVLAAADRGELP